MFDIGFAIWVVSAALLHGALGYVAVDYFTPYPPYLGFIFGISPDFDVVFKTVDLGMPFIHRGITHTPIFFGVVLMLLVISSRDPVFHSFFLSYGLHIVVDAMSGWGVMATYPLSTNWFLVSYGVNRQMNLILIVLSAVTVAIWLPPKRRFT